MELCIAGDSWGLGEWGMFPGCDTPVILHKGLEQFFSENGNIVKNISQGGIANKTSIQLLSEITDVDYIFWLQTDPLRDLAPYELFNHALTYEKLVDLSNELIDQSYADINAMNKIVYCIGGCSKLNLSLISKYKNLIPLIPSIPEMFIHNFTHPGIWQSDWSKLIGHQFSLDSLYKLTRDKEFQDILFDEKDLFWPDGRHLNRHGHKKLHDFICTTLNL